MAEWYGKLYVGEKLRRKEKKVRRLVDRGRFLPNVYLVTLSSNGQDQLDILEASYLVQRGVAQRLPLIVGMAFDYPEAIHLVEEIAWEAYQATGDCNLRKFLCEMREKV